MNALANQMKHQYGQSATALGDHLLESTSATELELAERIDIPVTGAQSGARDRTSAGSIVGTFRQATDAHTELDEFIELLLSQSLLATSTMDLLDLRNALEVSLTQKDYINQYSLLGFQRDRLYVAETGGEFLVYRHVTTTPTRSTTSRIAIQRGGILRFVTIEQAKKILASSEVDPKDDFFALAGSVSVEGTDQTGDSHDEIIYGD